MHKVAIIFGTRPEAIKMAPVIMQLKHHRAVVETKVIVTAQHREMLDQVLQAFGLSVDVDLDLMLPEQTLHELTATVITRITAVLKADRPDLVLVQGDTTTAFAVAVAAFYLKIPIGHVEAGLRTYDRFQPYPEETNRRLLSILSDLHFAPTDTARKNLLGEKMDPGRIRVTGNTVIDALLTVVDDRYDFANSPLSGVDFNRKWLLVTAHRRENFGKRLENICDALMRLAKAEPIEIIYPVHPNPQVRATVHARLRDVSNIHLLAPLSYEVFAQVMSRAAICLTDSGGIQEEAPSLGRPVLVMREVTERPEAVAAGTVALVGTDPDRIVKETSRLLHDENAYAAMANQVNPYGDGKAAKRIVSIVLRELGCVTEEEPPFSWTGQDTI